MFSLKIQSGKTPIDEKAAQTLIFGECFVVGQILFFPLLVHILTPLSSLKLLYREISITEIFFRSYNCFKMHRLQNL